MLMPVVIAGALPSVSNTDTGSYTAASTNPVTFSSRDLGDAGRRHIVIMLGWVSTPTVTSVSVAGITATLINTRTQGVINTALYIASVPVGTTGDVIVTFNTATSNVHIGVYALHNLRSATPVDTAAASRTTSGTINLDADVSSRGVVVSVVGTATSTPTPTLVGLTDRVDILTGAQAFYGGQYTATAAETPRIMAWSNTTGILCGCLATFR